LRLIVGTHTGHVRLFIAGPDALQSAVHSQFYANYPDCALDSLAEDTLRFPAGQHRLTAELQLDSDLFPLRCYDQFEDALNRVTADPLMGVLATLAELQAVGCDGRIELEVRPAGRQLVEKARRRLHRFRHPRFGGKPRLQERETQVVGEKLGRLLFETRLRVSVSGPARTNSETLRRLQDLVGSLGHFSAPSTAVFRVAQRRWFRPRPPPFLLSVAELATLFHPPCQTVQAVGLARVQSRELEPPAELCAIGARAEAVPIGRTQFRSCQHIVTLSVEDRLRHLALFGKTGTGKTTLLQNMLAADIAAGRGVACVDPHGDLADSLLELIPRSRTNDVVVFDVADAQHPLSFNLLACRDPAQRPLVASGIVTAFKKIYRDMWGPRLEHILRNALLALLEVPGSSLAHVLPLLCEDRYRRFVTAQVHDPAVRRFWDVEFADMPARLRGEAIAPVLNKVGHFISSPLLRNIVGQPRNALDLRAVMDRGAILIVNLSKGRIGEDASGLLGALVVTALQLAAMSRADTPEAARRPFFAYVDEFSNFATEAFASAFSEARKYRLALTVAMQFIEQLDEPTRASLFGNVGTLVAFQSSSQDAEVLAAELGGELLPADLTALPKYRTYTRLLVEGVPSRPFSMQTLPSVAPAGNEQTPDVLRRTSRHRYAQPRAKVEREIAAALA
jgi:ethanolamine utilization protein EutP (predicted NTPase)